MENVDVRSLVGQGGEERRCDLAGEWRAKERSIVAGQVRDAALG